MKKIKIIFMFVSSMVFGYNQTEAQENSEMKVKYMLSFDSTKNVNIAWVVPSYETPNLNNSDTEEKGVTAQFTIKIPKGAIISEIKCIKGEWETNPTKIGNSDFIKGLDDRYDYYVIGKAPSETNYGSFRESEPVALFTFKTNGAITKEKVSIIENHDAAIKVLRENYALNIASSFYSKSGQKASINETPKEQFVRQITLNEIIEDRISKLNEQLSMGNKELDLKNKLVCFPNPSTATLNIKLLVIDSSEKLKLDVVDMKGMVLKTQMYKSNLGFNDLKLDVSDLKEGFYLVKTRVGFQYESKKFVKQN